MTLEEAIRISNPGDTIPLGPGEYVGGLRIDKPLTLAASSPGQTVLRPVQGAPWLRISANVRLSGLIVDGKGVQASLGVEVTGGALAVEYCDFTSLNCAVLAKGPGASCEILNTRIDSCGMGVRITEGAQGRVADSQLDNCSTFPLLATQGARVTVERSRFHGSKLAGTVVQEQSSADFEQCEWAGSPSEADAQRRPIHSQLMLQAASRVSLRNCTVTGGNAIGVHVQSGGFLQATDCEISANQWAGMQVSDKGIAELTRCVVKENGGAGVLVTEGARLSGVELHCIDNKAAGVATKDAASFDLRACHLHRNAIGALIGPGCTGFVQSTDMSGNAHGPHVCEPSGRFEQG